MLANLMLLHVKLRKKNKCQKQTDDLNNMKSMCEMIAMSNMVEKI